MGDYIGGVVGVAILLSSLLVMHEPVADRLITVQIAVVDGVYRDSGRCESVRIVQHVWNRKVRTADLDFTAI